MSLISLVENDLGASVPTWAVLARSLECVCPRSVPAVGADGGEIELSQRTVEQVIGRLVTDEGFRRRFAQDPRTTIEEMVRWGCELNSGEWRALLRIDPRRFDELAEVIDPSLLKVDLSGGVS